MFTLASTGWLILAIGAFLVGFSKTAMPGLALISVAMYAAVLPAKLSTAALLLLLLVGDVFAISIYRREADWKVLRGLLPAVVVGIVVGTVFMRLSDDLAVKRVIGVILLILITLTLWQQYGPGRRGSSVKPEAQNRPAVVKQIGFGALGGFTTMTANAGGPVMSLYLLSMRFDVIRFLGTSAWFFFIVNLIKLPFSAGIGLINGQVLASMVPLVPLVVAGALVGSWVAKRMTSSIFDPLVWGLTIFGAIALLVW